MKRFFNTQSVDYKLLFWKKITFSDVLKQGLHTSLVLSRKVIHA